MKHLLHLFCFLFCSHCLLAQQPAATDSLGTTAHGLPVLRSYVEPDVVERAKKKFGRALYCIEKSTAANCQNSYLVGLLHNGRLQMTWMCDDPRMVRQQSVRVTNSAMLP